MNGHTYDKRICGPCDGPCVYTDEMHHRKLQNRDYIKQTIDAAMAGDVEAMLALRCIVATIAVKASPNVILSMNFFAIDMEDALSDGAVVRMVDEETPNVPTRAGGSGRTTLGGSGGPC